MFISDAVLMLRIDPLLFCAAPFVVWRVLALRLFTYSSRLPFLACRAL